MRTDIRFKLTCSVCGGALEADSDKSKIDYNSAFVANSVMAIKPCSVCYSNAKEPARMIARALKMADA
jgi:C4-type Zn-finger protein